MLAAYEPLKDVRGGNIGIPGHIEISFTVQTLKCCVSTSGAADEIRGHKQPFAHQFRTHKFRTLKRAINKAPQRTS